MAAKLEIPRILQVRLETGNMPRLNIDNLTGVAPIEPVLPVGGPPEIAPIAPGSFGNHLERARSSTAEPAVAAGDRTGVDPPRGPEDPPAADDQSTLPHDSTEAESARDSAEQSNIAPQDDQPEAADSEPNAAQTDTESDGETGVETEQKGKVNIGATAEHAQDVSGASGEEISSVDKPATGQIRADGGTPKQKTLADRPAQQSQSQAEPVGEQDAAAGCRIDESKTTTEPLADNTSGKLAHQASEPGDLGGSPRAVQSGQSPDQHSAEQSEAAGATEPAAPQRQGSDEDTSRPGQRRSSKKRVAPVGAAGYVSLGQANRAAAATMPDGAHTQLPTSSIDPAASAGHEEINPGPPATQAIHGSANQGEAGAGSRLASNQGAGAHPAFDSRKPSGPEQVYRVQFVRRVARAFQTVGDRGGIIRIRLHPPELGSLRLEINVRNGAMTARLEAETASARNMLLDNLPALRDRLAQQDIRVERFDVDLADRQPGGSPEGPGNQPPSQDLPEGQGTQAGRDEEAEAKSPSEPSATIPPGDGTRLNVVV